MLISIITTYSNHSMSIQNLMLFLKKKIPGVKFRCFFGDVFGLLYISILFFQDINKYLVLLFSTILRFLLTQTFLKEMPFKTWYIPSYACYNIIYTSSIQDMKAVCFFLIWFLLIFGFIDGDNFLNRNQWVIVYLISKLNYFSKLDGTITIQSGSYTQSS